MTSSTAQISAATSSSNVAAFSTPPSSASCARAEMNVWTPEQLRTFLDRTADHSTASLFRLAALAGMRRGELVGVEWADLDLDAGRLVVRHTITVKGQLIYGTSMTGRSRRTIDLDPMTAAILRATAGATRAAHGDGQRLGRPRPCVPQPTGEPGSPTRSRRLRPPGAGSELRDPVPRSAPHACESLLASGVNVKVVSERLGHASVAFTLDVYAHTMPGQQADAAAQVAAMIDAL